jgi:hypothetical protein
MIDKAMSSAGPSDDARGRRRTRDSDDGDDDLEDGSVPPPGSSKKRRRSRKGLDKKFECPHEGCGRSYSRAEHLYRHQLNRKTALDALQLDSPAQTIPSRYTTATSPTASDRSLDKTSAPATRRGTPRAARSSCGVTTSPTTQTR